MNIQPQAIPSPSQLNLSVDGKNIAKPLFASLRDHPGKATDFYKEARKYWKDNTFTSRADLGTALASLYVQTTARIGDWNSEIIKSHIDRAFKDYPALVPPDIEGRIEKAKEEAKKAYLRAPTFTEWTKEEKDAIQKLGAYLDATNPTHRGKKHQDWSIFATTIVKSPIPRSSFEEAKHNFIKQYINSIARVYEERISRGAYDSDFSEAIPTLSQTILRGFESSGMKPPSEDFINQCITQAFSKADQELELLKAETPPIKVKSLIEPPPSQKLLKTKKPTPSKVSVKTISQAEIDKERKEVQELLGLLKFFRPRPSLTKANPDYVQNTLKPNGFGALTEKDWKKVDKGELPDTPAHREKFPLYFQAMDKNTKTGNNK